MLRIGGSGRTATRLCLALALSAGLAGACDLTTTPSQTVNLSAGRTVTSFFATVPVGGEVFFSFTSPRDGFISLTLLELTVNGVGLEKFVNLGLGTPVGTTCLIIDSRTIQSGPSAQFEDIFPAGVYCVRLFDIGELTEPALAAVNIVHPK